MGTMIALRGEIRRWLSARGWLVLALATPAVVVGAATFAVGAPVGRSFFSVATTLGLVLVMLAAPLLALAAWLEVIPDGQAGHVRPAPLEVTLAKVLLVSLQTVTLAILVSVPAGLPVLLGSVPGRDLFATTTIVASAGLMMGGVTTCGFLHLRSPGRALALAYGVALATTVLATFVAAFLPTSDALLWPPEVSEIAGYVNPLAALFAVCRHQVSAWGWPFPAPLGDYLSPGPSIGPRLPVWPVYPAACVATAMALNALTLAKALVRRRATR